MASYAPYGYSKAKVIDGNKERPKLEIESNQAEIVKRIYKGVINGKVPIYISKELNGEGIMGPRGKGWCKTTLHKIMTNEVYIGTLVWGRESNRRTSPIRLKNGCASYR